MTIQMPTTSAAAATRPARPPGPPPGGRGGGAQPPSHEDAISRLGASLSTDVLDEMRATVAAMEADGASFDDIKSFVDTTLSPNGVELPGDRRGALVDTTM